MNRIAMIGFAALLVLRWYAEASGELGKHGIDALASSLMFVALFGSAQLFWLFQTRKPFSGVLQPAFALLALCASAFVMHAFGFFPGGRPPAWGGDAHFEVPVALILEWGIATGLYLPFHWSGTRRLVAPVRDE